MNATEDLHWLDSPLALDGAVERLKTAQSVGLDVGMDFHGRGESSTGCQTQDRSMADPPYPRLCSTPQSTDRWPNSSSPCSPPSVLFSWKNPSWRPTSQNSPRWPNPPRPRSPSENVSTRGTISVPISNKARSTSSSPMWPMLGGSARR